MPRHPHYETPWWLPGGHLQTIYPYLFLRPTTPPYRRERIETPDGDFLDLDWIDAEPDAPTVVLFHGLEGGSHSHYASSLMHAVAARRWRGVVVHFRGCSGEPNRLPRAYHSGDADEIDWVLRRLRLHSGGPVSVVGVSLGGNALLKWLGREQERALAVICAAVAVSAPMDLVTAGRRLGSGVCRAYGLNFLRSLKPKALEKLQRFPHLAQPGTVRRAFTLRDFDDAFTAPVHGFRNVDDYWTRASSIGELGLIDVPTLIVHARNDPFLPGRYLPSGAAGADAAQRQVDTPAANRKPAVEFDFPRHGGHVGFVSGPFPGKLSWLPQRVLGFIEERLRHCQT